MKVTFKKTGDRRYSVLVSRDRYPDLWCGSIGYDAWLPHDLLHFVAEAEFGLDGAVFGDLAMGGNARIFQSFGPQLTAKMWPGIPVVPAMSAGATDGAFLTPAGIPTYGVSGMFGDPDGNGAHGLNERLRVKSVYDGRDFLYQVVKTYAAAK